MKRTIRALFWLLVLEFVLMVTSLEPGFLDFDNLPDTNFSCVGKVIGGYYADLETNCQMFHVCTIGQLEEPMDIRFLCLNGTVFDQETRVCERIDEVDCSKSEQFYSLNLELYGNTQPPIVEESPEVDYTGDLRKTSTTVVPPSSTASTFAPFFTSSTAATTNRDISKVITSHHFPVNSPDIRFNPEEINISLKAGAPPDISRSQIPISYQQQTFSEKNTRISVTTHTTAYKSDKQQHRVPLLSTTTQPVQQLIEKAETTLTPKSIVSYGLTHNQVPPVATPTEINYGFSYPQTEESSEYHTDVPPHPYQYQLNIANFRPPTAHGHPYHSSFRNSNKRSHRINFSPTTYRNHPAFTSTTKNPAHHPQKTEKPPHLQLPLPFLPTLPPISFSSPSPFSIDHHIESKRYTKDHQSPPRIIISASASVSDNNGRRLNYSLGTIGASHILGSSPASYDDYKEEDVISDPFYHDVPKLKKTRRKRNTNDDIIQSDKEAEDLLRYLLKWYKKRDEKSARTSFPVTADDISQINDQLAPISDLETSTQSEDVYEHLFKKLLIETSKEKLQVSSEKKEKDKVIDSHAQTESKEENSTSVYNAKNKYEGEQKPSVSKLNETAYSEKENEDYDHENLEIHFEPTAKNHTRRSGRLFSSKGLQNRRNDYIEQDVKKKEGLVAKGIQEDLPETTSKFEDLELVFTEDPVTSHIIQEINETSVNSDQTLSTPFSYNVTEDDVYYDELTQRTNPEYSITESTIIDNITESLRTSEQPLAEYEYENIDFYYDNLNDDSTTQNPDFNNLTNNAANESTSIRVVTTVSEVDLTTTNKPNLDIIQSETQSLHKEWNMVDTSEVKISVTPPETTTYAIPDYVDDNYEPLSYQIHTPDDEYDDVTPKELEITTHALTTELGITEKIKNKEQQILTTIETEVPSTIFTMPSTDITTLTNPPTLTSDKTETTLVTEGIILESTTEINTEKYPETTLLNIFNDSILSSTLYSTETNIIADVSESTSTTETQHTTHKKEYPRHRFSSYTSRKRDRGRSKFIESAVTPKDTASSQRFTEKLNLAKSTDATVYKISSANESTIKLDRITTIPTNIEIENGTDVPLTDAPLLKSANPTRAKFSKIILSTTPLTKVVRIDIRKQSKDKRYIFNCFNKKIHHFYSDPRDCRLFHYCTSGYTKNQLVDMKFVCDFGTYYDEDKFICTKIKPSRCL
ncbi:hypothetical protein FQA39_LY01179 [Lamprigera yunnana]|nr:hypothetical protein FQA39_LY01179 [Lamprigera yunnana]